MLPPVKFILCKDCRAKSAGHLRIFRNMQTDTERFSKKIAYVRIGGKPAGECYRIPQGDPSQKAGEFSCYGMDDS
jgi:hypothetical protein